MQVYDEKKLLQSLEIPIWKLAANGAPKVARRTAAHASSRFLNNMENKRVAIWQYATA
jgi:hypothetical protein